MVRERLGGRSEKGDPLRLHASSRLTGGSSRSQARAHHAITHETRENARVAQPPSAASSVLVSGCAASLASGSGVFWSTLASADGLHVAGSHRYVRPGPVCAAAQK